MFVRNRLPLVRTLPPTSPDVPGMFPFFFLPTGGRGISRETALKHVFAYGVGVDLTRRDMQRVAKKAGRPWDCSKGFDSSGPVGALTPASDCAAGAGPGSENRAIWLRVNGGPRQESVLGEMIWSVPEMIARLSEVKWFAAGVVSI